jgi:hypothetical protein
MEWAVKQFLDIQLQFHRLWGEDPIVNLQAGVQNVSVLQILSDRRTHRTERTRNMTKLMKLWEDRPRIELDEEYGMIKKGDYMMKTTLPLNPHSSPFLGNFPVI